MSNGCRTAHKASIGEYGESFEVGLGLASPGWTRESQLTALLGTGIDKKNTTVLLSISCWKNNEKGVIFQKIDAPEFLE